MFSLTTSGGGRAAAGIVATLAAASGLALAATGSASAVQVDRPTPVPVTTAVASLPCEPNTVCLYEHVNYDGSKASLLVNPSDPAGSCFNVPAGNNDWTSSIGNRTTRKIEFYEHGGCLGNGIVVPPGAYAPNLGDFNDKMSSFKI